MQRVCFQRILPCLLSESSNANMVPFILPNIFEIAEMANEGEYTKHILPGLLPLFKLTDPIQVILRLVIISILLSKRLLADLTGV